MTGTISKREKYLMGKAYECGYSSGHHDRTMWNWYDSEMLDEWLDDVVADGVTVEMVLDKEADRSL